MESEVSCRKAVLSQQTGIILELQTKIDGVKSRRLYDCGCANPHPALRTLRLTRLMVSASVLLLSWQSALHFSSTNLSDVTQGNGG